MKPVAELKEADFVKDKFVVRNHYAAFVGPQAMAELQQPLYVVVKDKRNVSWYPTTQGAPARLPEPLKRWSISIPSFTILLVNFGLEFSGAKGNIKYNSVVVVDSPLIYGESISELPYEDR